MGLGAILQIGMGVAVVVGSYLAGNAYGPNALQLARHQANAAALDAALKDLAATEVAAWDSDQQRRQQQSAAFRDMLVGLDKCVLNEAQASALRTIKD